jgi:hypothetical protein
MKMKRMKINRSSSEEVPLPDLEDGTWRGR